MNYCFNSTDSNCSLNLLLEPFNQLNISYGFPMTFLFILLLGIILNRITGMFDFSVLEKLKERKKVQREKKDIGILRKILVVLGLAVVNPGKR